MDSPGQNRWWFQRTDDIFASTCTCTLNLPNPQALSLLHHQQKKLAWNTYSQSLDICFQKSGICSFERNFQMGAHQFCVEIQDVGRGGVRGTPTSVGRHHSQETLIHVSRKNRGLNPRVPIAVEISATSTNSCQLAHSVHTWRGFLCADIDTGRCSPPMEFHGACCFVPCMVLCRSMRLCSAQNKIWHILHLLVRFEPMLCEYWFLKRTYNLGY
jgi:hypothetical protein